MAWHTEGPKTDPTDGTVLADTGPMSAGIQNATLLVYTDVMFVADLVQRNALNTADLNVQPIAITSQLAVVGVPFTFVLNQRVLLRVNGNVTGHMQASILT